MTVLSNIYYFLFGVLNRYLLLPSFVVSCTVGNMTIFSWALERFSVDEISSLRLLAMRTIVDKFDYY